MSNTDKDRPYRVQAADPYQPGRYPRHTSYRYYWKGSTCSAGDGCDLPDFHDRTPEPTWHQAKDGRVTHDCTWELEHWVFSPYGSTAAPRWYTNHVWHAPERVRERDQLRAAAQLYNAGDDLEDFDFANVHHKHCARGWYW
jgi:hypothetical protein